MKRGQVTCTVQLAQCLCRDLLFRKFCHLELGGDVSEASTLRRFRTRLVEDGFIHSQSVTLSDVHDSQERDVFLGLMTD
ncbi:MAG: transposase [Endozoicomonadaceae bacterium]|nr:transposase [Endozoicomonadaceae bacterium]